MEADLDADAAARLPDLDQSLLLGDLKKSGWGVAGPKAVPGGGWQVSVSKPFSDSAQLRRLVSELSGPDGPFREFAFSRSHSFAKTSYRLDGIVDLSGGLDAFGDDNLRAALGGNISGRSEQQLATELGQPIADALRFKVIARLPGGVNKEWTPRLGDSALELSASSSDRKPLAWVFAIACIVALAGFVATVLLIARYNRIKAPPSYVHRPGGSGRPWDD